MSVACKGLSRKIYRAIPSRADPGFRPDEDTFRGNPLNKIQQTCQQGTTYANQDLTPLPASLMRSDFLKALLACSLGPEDSGVGLQVPEDHLRMGLTRRCEAVAYKL